MKTYPYTIRTEIQDWVEYRIVELSNSEIFEIQKRFLPDGDWIPTLPCLRHKSGIYSSWMEAWDVLSGYLRGDLRAHKQTQGLF